MVHQVIYILYISKKYIAYNTFKIFQLTKIGSHSKDNLVQAFVQFLEQESQPQSQRPQMPNLLNITHSPQATATPASRRSSNITNPAMVTAAATTTTSSSTHQITPAATTDPSAPNQPVPIQPLLLSSAVLDEFSPTRNSSSILKDILSDS